MWKFKGTGRNQFIIVDLRPERVKDNLLKLGYVEAHVAELFGGERCVSDFAGRPTPATTQGIRELLETARRES